MGITPQDFEFISRLVRERSAIVIDEGKEYLVESRLAPLLKVEGLESIDEITAQIRKNQFGPLTERVVEAMTTNETLFFRDRHPFETLREAVLPEVIERRSKEKKINIWCAASSSGQEPYSLCMVLKEHFPELASWNVQILATDISKLMLERTRNGIYSQLEVNRGLPAKLLIRYFEKDAATWQVKPELRQMLTLKEINLAGPWGAMPNLDIVLIRNVLIYFDADTKRDIMGRIRRQLSPGGVMFLGGSETTINIDDEFERIRQGSSWIYRNAS